MKRWPWSGAAGTARVRRCGPHPHRPLHGGHAHTVEPPMASAGAARDEEPAAAREVRRAPTVRLERSVRHDRGRGERARPATLLRERRARDRGHLQDEAVRADHVTHQVAVTHTAGSKTGATGVRVTLAEGAGNRTPSAINREMPFGRRCAWRGGVVRVRCCGRHRSQCPCWRL